MQRSTAQRRAIQQVIEAADRPLSPQEVLDAAKVIVPGLGIATVYRALKEFVDEGISTAVQLPGDAARYEVAGKGHHHHFHCRVCGQVYEVEACHLNVAKITPAGFEVEAHEVVLYGRCSTCVVSLERFAEQSGTAFVLARSLNVRFVRLARLLRARSSGIVLQSALERRSPGG